MSTQYSEDDIERIDGNLNALFERMNNLADRVDELEEENKQLREDLEDAKGDSELALAVAGETADKSRADGGPTKTKRAEWLSRNEVVRRALSGSNTGGSVTGGNVIDMARPTTNLSHRIVRNAWDNLAERWACLEVQEPDDRDNRLAVNRDDLEDELVRLVDQDLSDEDLTERFSRGRT